MNSRAIGSRTYSFLNHHGLTNRDSEDIGIYMLSSARSPVYGYCTSNVCCINIFGKRAKVKKNVDAAAVDCPDCGHALVWKTKKGQEAA